MLVEKCFRNLCFNFQFGTCKLHLLKQEKGFIFRIILSALKSSNCSSLSLILGMRLEKALSDCFLFRFILLHREAFDKNVRWQVL